MALKKDKARVIDEVWTRERVREFLHLEPPEGVDADFHALLRAYQSMRVDDFRLFIEFFHDQAGRRLDATGPDGVTVPEIVQEHRRSAEFAEALRQAGSRERGGKSGSSGGEANAGGSRHDGVDGKAGVDGGTATSDFINAAQTSGTNGRDPLQGGTAASNASDAAQTSGVNATASSGSGG